MARYEGALDKGTGIAEAELMLCLDEAGQLEVRTTSDDMAR